MCIPPAPVPCVSPSPSLTPEQARTFATDLIRLADLADGGNTLSSFVTRGEILDELRANRETMARITALLRSQSL